MQRIVNQLLTKKYYVVYLYYKDRNSPHIKKEEATMKKKNLIWYLGFIFVMTDCVLPRNRRFWLFCFAVDFQYFFIPSDEMLKNI